MNGIRDRLGGMKQQGMEQAARRFLEGERGTALLSVLATAERALLEEIVTQHELLGVEEIGALPTEEDRVEMLRELALAKLDGSLPAMWVEHFAPIEAREQAAAIADVDDWQAVKERWADAHRDRGAEGDVEQLADAHTRAVHGVDLETFEEIVVEWPDGREGAALEQVVASGVRAAHHGLEASNERLQELADDGVLPTDEGT